MLNEGVKIVEIRRMAQRLIFKLNLKELLVFEFIPETENYNLAIGLYYLRTATD